MLCVEFKKKEKKDLASSFPTFETFYSSTPSFFFGKKTFRIPLKILFYLFQKSIKSP